MKDELPALVWPRQLMLPPDTVKVVYLDLNHWISLSQAAAGHPKGSVFTKVLDACRAERSAGTALFVLSSTHYMELLKIKDPAQREKLADVMENLTGFSVLVDRGIIMRLELAAVIDNLLARKPSPQEPVVSLIGYGVRHALGVKSEFKVVAPSGEETQKVRDRIGAEVFDTIIAEATLLLERSVLRGPADADDVESLRALGWNPDDVMSLAEKRAAEERAQSARLDSGGAWRKGRLRDVISTRELIIEFQEILPEVLHYRGLTLADVVGDAKDLHRARAFVRAMPSTEVSVELKTAWHRNPEREWSANDIHDIDALAVAVPYCDIVVTEKACHHILTAARLGKRMHTAVLRNLEDLPHTLHEWNPIRPS